MDDTKALQAASNAANGGTLVLDPGMYLTSGLVIKGPVLVDAAGAVLKAAAGTAPLLSVQRASTIVGVGLNGNGKTKPGITVSHVSGVTISDCSITRIKSDPAAINLDHATNFAVTGCVINDSSVDSIEVYFSSHGHVDRNKITNSRRHGIEWWGGDSAHPAGPNGVTDVSFANNTVKSVGGGGIWGSMGQQISVTGNTVETCGDVCIDPEGGTDIAVRNNYVRNGINAGISVFFAATYVSIRDNISVSDVGYGHPIMIFGQGTCRNLTITANNLTTAGADGIYSLNNTLSDSTLTGNTITQSSGKGVNIQGGTGNTINSNQVTSS